MAAAPRGRLAIAPRPSGGLALSVAKARQPASRPPPLPADGGERSRIGVVDLAWMAAIAAVALTLRIVYIRQLQHYPLFSTLQMDPLFHDQWARATLRGETFMDGAYFRAPLYPWFLAGVYRLVGADGIAPRVAQAALGALSCATLFLLGRVVFSRAVGVIAGLAAATYWILIYFDAELLISVLIVFLDLWLLLALIVASRRRRAWLWLVSGLLLGLSAIARPNILLFAPALVAWIALLYRPAWRSALGYAACLFVGCMAPILPITIRNYVVGKDAALIATQAGVNFYIGNNPAADGMSAVIPGDPTEWWPCYYAQIERAEKALGRKLKGSEVSRWYARQTWRFMAEQPAAAAALLLAKVGYFWSHWEVSNNQDIRFVTSTYTPIVRYLPLSFWVVGPLGALGLLLCLRRARELFPLWGFTLIYMLSVVAFFVTARYRVPVVVVLILLASHAAVWLFDTARRGRWRALGLAALTLALMGGVVARTPPNLDADMIQGHRSIGLYYAEHGDAAQAERFLAETARRAAERGFPLDARTWHELGEARVTLNRPDDAIDCLRRAIALEPTHARAHTRLAMILQAKGQTQAAIEHLMAVAEAYPDNANARVNLAVALLEAGQVDEALPHMRAALAADRGAAADFAALVQPRVEAGDLRGAIAIGRVCVQAAPDELTALVPLVQLLAGATDPALRDVPEALRLADHARRLTQDQDAQVLTAAGVAYAAAGERARACEALRTAITVAQQRGQARFAQQAQRRRAALNCAD